MPTLVRFPVLRRFAIVLIVVCLAAPVRFWVTFGPFASLSVLDAALVTGGIWLLLLALTRNGIHTGGRRVFIALCFPLVLAILSLSWTQDVTASIRWTLVNVEAMVAYLLALRLFHELSPRVIMRSILLFVVVCIFGAGLAFLRVPGFEPRVPPEFSLGSPNYVAYLVSFYARLSHPFIGLSNDFASALNCYVLVLFGWGYIQNKRTYQLLAAITAMAMTFTLSRGVLIPMVVTGVLFFFKPQLRRMLPWLGALLVLMALGIFAYYALVPDVGATLGDRTSDSNVEARLLKYRVGFDKIMERPLLGYGSGVDADAAPELQGGAHNIVIDMMLYFGIVPGMVVFLSIASLPLTFFDWQTDSPKVRFMASALGYALVSQVAIFLSETSFDAPVLRVLFYFFMGTAVALITDMDCETSIPQLAAVRNVELR